MSSETKVLDLYGMNGEQIINGRTLFGGSNIDVVHTGEQFDTIVFGWGDDRVEDIFSRRLENSSVDERLYTPFGAATITLPDIWMLTIQEDGWHPDIAYEQNTDYVIIPYDRVLGAQAVAEYASTIPTDVQATGKITSRYVYFGVSTKL